MYYIGEVNEASQGYLVQLLGEFAMCLLVGTKQTKMQLTR